MSEERRDDQRPDDTPQTLVSHLLELRNRLLKTLVVVLVIFLGLFYFSRDLYTLVARPLMDAMPAGTNMIATGVASPFLAPFKLTLYLSIFVAMPFILHQAWAFVAPGLYGTECSYLATTLRVLPRLGLPHPPTLQALRAKEGQTKKADTSLASIMREVCTTQIDPRQ